MDDFSELLLLTMSEIDQIVVVKDSNNRIIYINNEKYKDIVKCDLEDSEVLFNNNYYKVKTKSIKTKTRSYNVELYTDITKRKKLQIESSIDHLTQLYNFKHINHEIDKAIANGEDFVLAMCDIDDFKKLNDTIGHIEANEILKDIGKTIKNNIRTTDCAGRFGGEEFIIILKHCPLENAIKKIELIRRSIENMNTGNKKTTMSFGVEIYDGSKSIQKVYRNADLALYESKTNGKNQISVFNEHINKKTK